jgi:hypothetical protein
MRSSSCLFFLFALLLLVLSPDLVKAAFPDFETNFEDESDHELAAFHRVVAGEMEAFRDERDLEFAAFLEEQWKEFEEFAGLVPSRIPKPVSAPIAKIRPTDSVPPGGKTIDPDPVPEPAPDWLPKPEPVPVPQLEPVPAPTPDPAPELEPAPEPEPEPAPVGKPGKARADCEFHGQSLKVLFDPRLSITLGAPVDNHAIGDFWKIASQADFAPLVEQLERLRNELRLNDWGYFQLVKTVAEEIQASSDDATLFTWFLLTKSGFRAKVGYGEGKVSLLVPSENTIYQVPYFTLEGMKYYNLTSYGRTEKTGRLFIHEENYPAADRRVDLALEVAPNFRTEPVVRVLRFHYGGREHQVAVTASRSLVGFFDRYPQTDLPVFFAAAASREAEESLLVALRRLVADKNETEAVNLLLRFVQTAFEYKTDDQQFGREKCLFVDETVFFPYSDCEDRSVLFSFLVRRLTGLKVVGLLYPGHVATAVRFTEEVPGDGISVDGKQFVICDPTFINADLGTAMPKFKYVTPKVILAEM